MEKVIEQNIKTTDKSLRAKSALKLFACLFLIVAVAFILIFAFNLSQYAFGQDIRYHYEIIRALDVAWNSGEGIPRVIDLVGQDYGYGTGLFYSLIPAGIAVILMNIFNLTISNAVALEISLLLALSGIVMFFFIRTITKNNIISALSAVIYITSPYILTDIFMRFAFSEMFLILSIPLIMFGVYELVNCKNPRNFFLPFVIGYSISIMTHLTVTVFFTFLVLIYLLIYIKEIFKQKLYIPLIISTICVLLITATYYLPMFINYSIVGLDNMSYTPSFVSFNGLWSFILPWLLFSSVLNIFVIWVFIKNLSDNRGHNSKDKKVLFAFLVLSFIMSTCLFPWFILPSFVGIIQYAWRMFIVNMPLLAISIGYLLKNDKFFSHKFALCFGSILALVGELTVCVNNVFLTNGKLDNTILKSSVNQIVNGKSVNRGLGASKKGDYLPKGCETDYVFTRVNSQIVIDSNVKLTELANYQSINQLSFIITKNNGASSILKIPYNLILDAEIYQISDDYISSSLEIYATESDGWLCINYAPCETDSKITIVYEENGALDLYLKQNPFEFIVEKGEVEVTNFVKKSVSNYSFDVVVDSSATIELPTLYYVGYEITFVSNGEEIKLEPIKNSNGFISINVERSGSVKVEFVGNYVGKSNIITSLGVGITLILTILAYALPKRFTVITSKTKEEQNNI